MLHVFGISCFDVKTEITIPINHDFLLFFYLVTLLLHMVKKQFIRFLLLPVVCILYNSGLYNCRSLKNFTISKVLSSALYLLNQIHLSGTKSLKVI